MKYVHAVESIENTLSKMFIDTITNVEPFSPGITKEVYEEFFKRAFLEISKGVGPLLCRILDTTNFIILISKISVGWSFPSAIWII